MYSSPFRAGDGDRTRDSNLEGWRVTATPHPQGDSGRTRTYDRLLRRQLLYPTELLNRVYPHIIERGQSLVKLRLGEDL
jgi:hypothetical protein